MILTLKNLIYSTYTFYKEFLCLIKGQRKNAELLQLAHRLEKGLTISNPRPLWGWEKAESLYRLALECDNEFAYTTAMSVLQSYLNDKVNADNVEDKAKAEAFYDSLDKDLLYSFTKGGAISLKRDEVMCRPDESFSRVLTLRHSVRDFANTPVDQKLLERAILMANSCPSACNRQPYHVYIVDDNKWRTIHKDGNQVYGADKHLLITADIRAYSIDEINDWIVSASIYAGYLTLTLTSLGIASCVIRKRLLEDRNIHYLKEQCGIPKDSKVIIEIAVGNYKDEFKVAFSNRKNADQLLTIVE